MYITKKTKLVKLCQDFYDILISGGEMISDSRLSKMLYYLLDRKRATAPELAAEFEVSTRTIKRCQDICVILMTIAIQLYRKFKQNFERKR